MFSSAALSITRGCISACSIPHKQGEIDMRTKLAIIAVSGFAVSAVCLGGAFALGGHAIGTAVFGTDLAEPRRSAALRFHGAAHGNRHQPQPAVGRQ